MHSRSHFFLVVGSCFFALSGFRNLPYAEDTDLWERATAAGWKLKTVDHPKTYIYQQSPDSITQNYRQS